MAELLHLELVTPERHYATMQAEMVVVPGELGDLGIMAHHAPLISMIRPGMIDIHDDRGTVTRYFVSGGYANISDNNCTILAESLIPHEELVRDDAEKALAELAEKLKEADSDVARAAIQRRIMEEETKLILAS